MRPKKLLIDLPPAAGKHVRQRLRERGLSLSKAPRPVRASLAVVVSWDGEDVVIRLPQGFELREDGRASRREGRRRATP